LRRFRNRFVWFTGFFFRLSEWNQIFLCEGTVTTSWANSTLFSAEKIVNHTIFARIMHTRGEQRIFCLKSNNLNVKAKRIKIKIKIKIKMKDRKRERERE